MHETQNSGARRLSFMIPLLLFVLFFVACCGVVAGVFLRAAAISGEAGDLSAGVQLCRSRAEWYRAQGASRDTLPPIEGELTFYYSEDLSAASGEDAAYCVTVSETLTAQSAGTLRTGTITARSRSGETVYTLSAAVYLPEGR